MFKKRLVTFLVAVALCFTAVSAQPKRADAIVAVTVANPASLAVIIGLGLLCLSPTPRVAYPDDAASWAGTVWFLVAGLIFLDDHGQQKASFIPADAYTMAKVGLTPQEVEAYNRSVDELNAAAETISESMQKSGDTSSENAKTQWEAFRGKFLPEAFSAAQKIAASAFGNI